MKKCLNILVLIFFCLISYTAMAKNCEEVRMGLDLGSGSTKIMVAKVDFCKSKIIKILHNDSRALSYNEDLEKSTSNELSAEIVDKGLSGLKEMIAKGKTFKPKKSYGVATSVFRKAKNGADVIKSLSKTLKTRLEVISQEDEAMLGYLSAFSQMDDKEADSKKIVVWDIGGGSMQMFSHDENRTPHKYLGDLASVNFKNMVIEVLQNKSLAATSTPNPIGDMHNQVVALARSYARIHVPADIKILLKDYKVIGVGGVHNQSIKNQLQLKEPKYTLEELEKFGKMQSEKSDQDLTGDYRSTDVTNILLVQGFMEALGIKEVKTLNVSLIQGVVLR